MDNDNLYPSGGFQPFAEPAEQKSERSREQGHAKAAEPLLREIIEHFDQRIAFYDSVDSIAPEDRNTPEDFLHRFEANVLAKQNLVDERDWVKSLLDTE